MKKLLVLLLVCMLSFSLLAACAKDEPANDTSSDMDDSSADMDDSSTETSEDEEGPVIGFCLQNLTNPQFFDQIDAVQAVVDAAGGTLIKMDAQFDMAKQVNQIENLISQGVDGIMVTSVDPNGLVEVIKQADEAGIPIIAIDAFLQTEGLTALVTSDNYAGGYAIGQQMNKDLGGEGNLFVVNIVQLIDCQERVQGVWDGLGPDSNVKFITQQNGGDMAAGMQVMEAWLEKYDDIDAVYCINDSNALGCIAAIKAAGREDEIKVYGNDGTVEAYADMAKDDSILMATVQQQSTTMGRVAAETLLKAINGEKVDPIVFIPVYMVTKEDVQNGLERPSDGTAPKGLEEAVAPAGHVIGEYDYEEPR